MYRKRVRDGALALEYGYIIARKSRKINANHEIYEKTAICTKEVNAIWVIFPKIVSAQSYLKN